MGNLSRFEDWDDRSVLLTLSHLTHDMLEHVPEQERQLIRNEAEARAALSAFVAQAGDTGAKGGLVLEAENDPRFGRQLLERLAADPELGERAESLIAEPPEDDQMAAGIDLVTGAVVLGALVTWLQSQIEFSVERKDGQLNWTFKFRKQPTSPAAFAEIATKLRAFLG